MAQTIKRIFQANDPFVKQSEKVWREQGNWPASWITCPETQQAPFVCAYRLAFQLEKAATLRFHLTADERYEFYVDGVRVLRGPEKGDPFNWFFESLELSLEAGTHTFVAHTWALGEVGPLSQMTVQPGFLLAAESPYTELVSTGLAAWETKELSGYTFVKHEAAFLREHMPNIDGRTFSWDFERGLGRGWQKANILLPGMGKHLDWDYLGRHWLKPATLPAMLEPPLKAGKVRHVEKIETLETSTLRVEVTHHLANDTQAWQNFLNGNSLALPAHTGRRIIIDLEDYYCAYSELVVSGGDDAVLRLHWAESLRTKPEPFYFEKGNRDDIEQKFFIGVGSTFTLEGGTERRYQPLWWQAGRYLELCVITKDKPLTLHKLELIETRYPLECESHFEASEPHYAHLLPLFIQGIQATAHDTFEDSPHFEQQMYVADARLESLCTYVMTRDDRLQQKALRLFDSSRLANGLIQSRYPSRSPQIIPSFSLWWLGMVHDYAHWRGDRNFLTTLMPGVRATTDAFLHYQDEKGLLHNLEGWNFLDWVPAWEAGVPSNALWGANGLLNWLYVYALSLVTDLHEKLGEHQLANYYRSRTETQAEQALVFWDETRGLLADDLHKTSFSEHTQAIALLSGCLSKDKQARVARGLLSDTTLTKTTYFFTHYLFEAYAKLGEITALQHRLGEWQTMLELGLKAPLESPEPSRSDCHGWSAHPLVHFFTTILGIRPCSLEFAEVEIRPQLGRLESASGTLVHPKGEIQLFVKREGDTLHGNLSLPRGVKGYLSMNNERREVLERTSF